MAARKSSTIDNRVSLFKDLASAWLGAHGDLLASDDAADRNAGLRALADIARTSCVVADSEGVEADEVAEQLRTESSATAKKSRKKK